MPKIIETPLDLVSGLKWATPPECQGQVVTYSYAWSVDLGPVMRRFDAGDRTTELFAADEATASAYDAEPERFDPVNREPKGTWDVRIVQTKKET